MELRDLEYFAVVAEHCNVTRASEALGLSPPAVSKSLRRLEASIEAKLFERSPKGVTLTAVGVALLARLRPLRLALADVVREASDLSQGRAGHLRIGANPVDAEYLPAAYSNLLKDSLDLTIEITVSDIDVTLPLLRKGELDVIVVVAPDRPFDDLVQENLYDDEYVVSASADHRLAKRKLVAIAELAQERWALSESTVRPQQLLRRIFEEHGLPPPRVAVESRSQRVKLLTSARSDLLGFTSRQVVRDAAGPFRLAILAVKELTVRRPVCVLYRKDSYLSPVARRLIESLRAKSPKVSGGRVGPLPRKREKLGSRLRGGGN